MKRTAKFRVDEHDVLHGGYPVIRDAKGVLVAEFSGYIKGDAAGERTALRRAKLAVDALNAREIGPRPAKGKKR